MICVAIPPEAPFNALRLVSPLLFGEMVFFLINGLVTRRAPTLTGYSSPRRDVTEILSRLRLHGRGLDLCVTGAGLHLAVAFSGTQVFPRSLILTACDAEPSFWWMWGAVIGVLIGAAAVLSRDLHIEQLDLTRDLLDKNGALTQTQAREELNQVQRNVKRTRPLRVLVRVLGWSVVYSAILLALLPY